ncbi:phage holin [Paenibacillus pinihumi]|uniref:phage holin n=1 Tax=Paenibacillus pinihumi TaxID=669462 RepID=UPI00041205E0|nr:phage holin [Paenibacillus pinihumi]
MNELIQPYVQSVLLGVLSLLTAIVTGALFEARKRVLLWLDTRTSNEQRELLHKLAGEAFSFAETVYKEAGGPAKLEQAYQYLSKRLQERGIELEHEDIRSAIEKAVLEYKTLKAPIM